MKKRTISPKNAPLSQRVHQFRAISHLPVAWSSPGVPYAPVLGRMWILITARVMPPRPLRQLVAQPSASNNKLDAERPDLSDPKESMSTTQRVDRIRNFYTNRTYVH